MRCHAGGTTAPKNPCAAFRARRWMSLRSGRSPVAALVAAAASVATATASGYSDGAVDAARHPPGCGLEARPLVEANGRPVELPHAQLEPVRAVALRPQLGV